MTCSKRPVRKTLSSVALGSGHRRRRKAGSLSTRTHDSSTLGRYSERLFRVDPDRLQRRSELPTIVRTASARDLTVGGAALRAAAAGAARIWVIETQWESSMAMTTAGTCHRRSAAPHHSGRGVHPAGARCARPGMSLYVVGRRIR